MSRIKVYSVRLNFFRSDISIPNPVPPYYIFGEYDYLGIERADSLDANPSAEAAALTTLFDAENLDRKESLNRFISGRVEKGLLVRLDLGLTNPQSQRNWFLDLLTCATAATNILNQKSVCLLSVGSCSIYLLIDLTDSDLEEVVCSIASIALGDGLMIARTTTSVIISATRLQNEQFVGKSESPVLAQISISCPLRRQYEVYNYSNSLKARCPGITVAETLGDYDIALYFKEKLSIVKLATITRDLRAEFPECRTFTHIAAKIAENLPRSNSDDLGLTFPDLSVPDAPSDFRVKVEWLESRLKASSKDKIGQLAQNDLIPVLSEVISYARARPERAKTSGFASEALDALIEAFMQRGGYRSLPSRDHDLALTNIATGAFIPLKALRTFIELLYQHAVAQVSREFRQAKKAQNAEIGDHLSCLPIANNDHGFESFPFSIFLVPYDVLLLPCQKQLTWQTLSHELSHILTAWYLTDDDFQVLIEKHIDALAVPGKIPKETYHTTVDGDFREFAAHYIDFVFFYEGNLRKYLRAIWATWPTFASQSKNQQAKNSKLRHYILRSFAVYVAQDRDVIEHLANLDFSKPSVWLKGANELLNVHVSKFLNEMELSVCDPFDLKIVLDADSQMTVLPMLVGRLSPLMKEFLNRFSNSTIGVEAKNSQPVSYELEQIQAGYICESNKSVLHSLVRDSHLDVLSNQHGDLSLDGQLALMLTYARDL